MDGNRKQTGRHWQNLKVLPIEQLETSGTNHRNSLWNYTILTSDFEFLTPIVTLSFHRNFIHWGSLTTFPLKFQSTLRNWPFVSLQLSMSPQKGSGAKLHGLVPRAKALNVLNGLPKTQVASTGPEQWLGHLVWIRRTFVAGSFSSPIPSGEKM